MLEFEKLRRRTLVESIILASLIASAVPGYTITNNCAVPPGPAATIQCDDDQIAICEANGSRAFGQCLARAGKSGKDLEALVLTRVLERDVKPNEVEEPKYQEVLRNRTAVYYHKNPGGGKTVVTFSFGEYINSTQIPSTQSAPTKGSGVFTCTACAYWNGEKQCEIGSADNKDEAAIAATEGLKRRLLSLAGSHGFFQGREASFVECK